MTEYVENIKEYVENMKEYIKNVKEYEEICQHLFYWIWHSHLYGSWDSEKF